MIKLSLECFESPKTLAQSEFTMTRACAGSVQKLTGCKIPGWSSKMFVGYLGHPYCCIPGFWLVSQFSRSVVSDSLRPHELQHARPPCPSPTPGVHSNSCPLSLWCHPAISSSVIPFSSYIQSWHTPFLICNQSVVPCAILTVASWPAYRFSRGRSGGLVFPSLKEFSTVYCDPHSQRLWHSQ